MTDQRLRDLMHDSVADATTSDFADAAWRSARRARGRRTASLAAGVTASVVVAAGSIVLVQRDGSDPAVTPAPTGRSTTTPTTPTTPTTSSSSSVPSYVPDATPDAHYAGVPVWWSPALAQEPELPIYPAGALPPRIDLHSPDGSITDSPIHRAVAAFAATSDGTSLQYVRVLTPDGRLLSVDTSRVQPMTDPEGNQRYRVGPSLLSRGGQYLLFPQDHSLLIYTLETGRWRTVRTGSEPTWNATWIANTRISLADPTRPQAQAREYSITGVDEGSGNVIASGIPEIPLGSSQIYGRARTSLGGIAQAFSAGAPIPEPPRPDQPRGSSDWIAVTGQRPAILLVPNEAGRQKQCCQVDGWLAPHVVMYDSSSSSGTRVLAWNPWTGQFFQVTRLTGVERGQESVAASYAQVPAAGAPMRY